MQVSKNDTIISTYTYDANGNRITHITPISADSGTYDVQDRLLTYSSTQGLNGSSTQYLYSQNGDLRLKIVGTDTTHYDYDAMGNLLSVILPNGSHIEYVTDGAGRRIIRKVTPDSVGASGQITNRWLYSDELRISGEVDSAGNVVSHFVYATKQNVPEYIVKGGITYRVIMDQLGSVRQVVNVTTGEIVQQMDYDEYGNVTNSSGQQIVPMGFAGGLYDAETGLIRFGARDYDAISGRWLVRDPILFNGSQTNLYVYCTGDPINLSDQNGKLAGFFNLYVSLATGSIGAISGAMSALAYHGNAGDVLTSAGVGFVAGFVGGGFGRGWGSVAMGFMAGASGNMATGKLNLFEAGLSGIMGAMGTAMYAFASDEDMVGLAIGATVMVSGAQLDMLLLYRSIEGH